MHRKGNLFQLICLSLRARLRSFNNNSRRRMSHNLMKNLRILIWKMKILGMWLLEKDLHKTNQMFPSQKFQNQLKSPFSWRGQIQTRMQRPKRPVRKKHKKWMWKKKIMDGMLYQKRKETENDSFLLFLSVCKISNRLNCIYSVLANCFQ